MTSRPVADEGDNWFKLAVADSALRCGVTLVFGGIVIFLVFWILFGETSLNKQLIGAGLVAALSPVVIACVRPSKGANPENTRTHG